MREVQKYRYGAALVLTVMVFLMGVMFSNLMDQQRSESLNNEIQQDLTDLESNQLQLSYLRSNGEQSCDVLQTALTNIVEGYNERLDRVQEYESDSFFRSEEFENIKHRYVLSGVRYWMFAEEVRERCGQQMDTVLFFTTTLEKDDCPECESTGRQLTLLKQEYGDDILIFSIPVSMDDGIVEILEDQFNVTETPTLVINGDVKMEEFQSRSEIRQHLNVTGGEE